MYKIRGADQKEYGPVSAEQIRQWIAEHRLNAQSMAQMEGSPEWKLLSQFPEFVAALATGPEVAPPLPAVPTLTGAARPKTNVLAIAGFVMGILSITGCLCCYGLPCNILGLVFSIVALTQINRNPAVEQGRGLAIAGIILSAIGLIMGLVFVFIAPAIGEYFRREYGKFNWQ
jgi:hypothetical protein